MTPQQLKASVLQMAIEGKLVPQLDDEPAVEIDAAEPEEVPFAIPEKWRWATIVDVMENISTGPFGSMLHKTDYVAEGIPVINPANLATGRIIPSSSMMVSAETMKRLESYCLHAGMVVMGRRGEMGRCAEVTEKEDGWLCGTGSFFMKPHPVITTKFICLFFSTAYARNYLLGESIGTTMSNLNHKILKRLPIPVPPRLEQKRIFAQLSEILPHIEEYGESYIALQNIEKSLPDQLRASLLQEAIQGKLVPQLDDEPAVEIDAAEPEEVPFAIPEKWKWVLIDSICQVKGGKRIPAGRKLTTEDTGYKYLRVSDMKDRGVDLNHIMYIEKDIYEQIKKYTISCNDIYITVAGTIGRVGIIPIELDGINLTENADKLVLNFSYVDQKWMLLALSSEFVQNQIRAVTTKVGQPKLAIKRIEALLIPLPSLDEQRRIVARLEDILLHLDNIVGINRG